MKLWYLLFSDELFWCARRGKLIDFALFILKSLHKSWRQFLTNFVNENVEKEGIWDQRYIPHWRVLQSLQKYSQNIPNECFVTPISSIEQHILLTLLEKWLIKQFSLHCRYRLPTLIDFHSRYTVIDFQRFFEEQHYSIEAVHWLIILSIINTITIFADPDELQMCFFFL